MDWLSRIQSKRDPKRDGESTEYRAGDQVRVWYRIQEKGRVRTASFEGIVIRVRGSAANRTLTVRRVSFGEGVERVFPLDSPTLERVEHLRQGKTKRSRMYFLRTIIGKSRIVSTEVSQDEEASKRGSSAEAESVKPDATPAPEKGTSDQASAPGAADPSKENVRS